MVMSLLFRLLPLTGLLPLFAQTYSFSDGGTRLKVDFAPNEVYATVKRGMKPREAATRVKTAFSMHVQNTIEMRNGGLLITLAEPAGRNSFRQPKAASEQPQFDGLTATAPVFYVPGQRGEAAMRLMTNRLLVRFEQSAREAQWEALKTKSGAVSRKDSLLGAPWMIVEFSSAYDALDAALAMVKDGGWEFTPVFARQFNGRQAKAAGPLQRSVNDPLFPNQWHLANTGPSGIRMQAAWDSVTGRGINIAVIDDGVDIGHEDLSSNAYPLASGYHRNFNEGDPANPSPDAPGQNHGTNCAGLIAAQGFNNIGVIGVAPEARLMGLRLIAGPAGDDATGEALAWQPSDILTHVSSNSWGPADDGKDLGRTGSLQRAGLVRAATTNRDGLGTVFAVSAGNGRSAGDDSSYDAFASSRFVIGVGAVNRDGKPSSFSEQGINVAISALGGEFDPPGVIWTTNNAGPAALAALREKFEGSQAPENYSDAFNGTSAAAPQVSGAAALLLQHNPKLGYRDVKEILMRTATRAGLTEGDAFVQNGGGLFFSHSFGAGLLNVAAAVDLARGWTNLGPLTSVSQNSGDFVQRIPDASLDGAALEFDFFGERKLRVESVEVTVNVEHARRGDLGFIIASPSGMVSVVDPRSPDEGADFEDYTFTSVRHWGESSAGKWTVKVVDAKSGVSGRAGAITVRLHGVAQ